MRVEQVPRVCAARRFARLMGFVLLIALAMVRASASSAAAATASVGWRLQLVAQPTSFQAGETHDVYVLLLTNVGSRASSGGVTVTINLPIGLTTSSTPRSGAGVTAWKCTPEGEGQSVVSCTTEAAVPALAPAGSIVVPIKVQEGAASPALTEVEVSGGVPECNGSGKPPCPTGSTSTPTPLNAPALPFGLLEFNASVLDASGAPDTTAADHPGAQTTTFGFPSATTVNGSSEVGPFPVEYAKQIVIDLPPGLIGNPQAAPACPLTNLTDLGADPGACPPATRVGTVSLLEAGHAESDLSLFNVVPEHGFAAEFAVYDPELQRASLLYGTLIGNGADSHLRLMSAPQNRSIVVNGLYVTFFGDPAVMDSSANAPVAFFTNPSDCSASALTTTIHVDSWQHPAKTIEPGVEPDFSDANWKSASSVSPPVTGCQALQFHPTLSFAPEPEHSRADEPAGYAASLRVPQNEDPNALATPPLKTVVMTLPPGVAISPAAGDGLLACRETGPEAIEPGSPSPGHCPAASTVGSAELVTPTLNEALKGSVYLAQPMCGGEGQPACTEEAAETGGLFALDLEAGSEVSGAHLKLKGKVEVGGSGQHSREVGLQRGQVRVTFADVPQQSLSELRLSFNGGPRALLANPQTCGSFTTESELEPWSHQPAPGEAAGTPNATPTSAFAITGCESKFAPGFIAGTVDPQAGANSPFTLTFSRQDREPDLSGVTASMPPGLLGKIAGVPQCPEPQASAGTCPTTSRIGSATTAAGAGSHPFWRSGSAYLTGPYKGAPFGLSVVVPARVGPFNLGNIVVRGAISVDPHTAALSVAIDPLPPSVDGVPLRVRTVNLTIERFFFNPTNCNSLAIDATISSVQGATAHVASRFQAANCRTLPFKPKLTALTYGNGEFAGHGASLHIVIVTQAGQANIRSLKMDLPQRLPARLETIQKACPEHVFRQNPAACPKASVIGSATAGTPVLDTPMTGPAVLVSHGGRAFPDMVLVLQAQGVRIDLTGALFVDQHNVTSTTFRTIPDVPIRRLDLVLPEGKRSVLPASASLCSGRLHMLTAITGQNGARMKPTVKVAVAGCKHKKKHKRHRTHGEPTHNRQLAAVVSPALSQRRPAGRAAWLPIVPPCSANPSGGVRSGCGVGSLSRHDLGRRGP